MKNLIRQELDKSESRFKKLVLAEFLQHLVLQSIYRQDAFKNIVFTGGTALRILYHTGRYSEDLDFSLVRSEGFEFRPLIERIQKDLDLQGIQCEMRLDEEKTIANAELKFSGILNEFQLSPLKSQKLMVKLEIDKRPPKGGVSEIALVTTPISYTVAVFNLASLFATKLHAVFFRRYTKGRDYYDLMWFLGKQVKPNFELLNNATFQTQGEGHEFSEGKFKERLIKHLESINFSEVRAEVERFVIQDEELKFLELEALKSLLRYFP